MKIKLILTAFIVALFTLALHAQVTPQTQPQPKKTLNAPAKRWKSAVRPAVDTVKNTDFSLNGQYQFLLSRSRNINGYRLVNPNRLASVWKSVQDTLLKERKELAQAKSKLSEQAGKIGTLQAEVKGSETAVDDVNAKMDEITFLGISFSKGTYNIIVWSLIAVLAIALFVVVARSAKSIAEARHRTQLYDEISTEYQNYKAKASEKERKLARELQDERNIVEELRSGSRG